MNDSLRHRLDDVQGRVDEAAGAISEAIAEIKPRLRGWSHAIVAPLALAAGVVLVVLSPNATTRIGSAVFAASALVLFTVSAIYHRGDWSPRMHELLRRFDHSNIYMLIAGTLTPFALLLLDGTDRLAMLAISWGGAFLGVALKVFWGNAPRWLDAPVYILLGWAPIFFLGAFISGAMDYGPTVGTTLLVLVVAGGGLYTVGDGLGNFVP